MINHTLVRVAVDCSVFHIDKPYTYSIPETLKEKAVVGARVIVPFGNGNKKKQGIIIDYDGETAISQKIKSILEVVDETPILNNEMMELVKWIKDRTFCTYYDVVKAILPPGISYKFVPKYVINNGVTLDEIEKLSGTEREIALMLFNNRKSFTAEKICKSLSINPDSAKISKLIKKGFLKSTENSVRNTGDASVKTARLNPDFSDKLTPKQQSVVDKLKEFECCSVKELCYFSGCGISVINALAKKNAIVLFEQEYYRKAYTAEKIAKHNDIMLTDEQQSVFSELKALSEEEKPNVALLYGVTGSGKTQVFLRLCDEVLEKGKSVIVMVPEIALTPQTLNIFHSRYGDKVAVFHSAMSQGKRLDEWKRVRDGKAQIAIGTRTAVFAPFKNLGLIIIDEEHEHTYKSDKSPRFHARDVAKFRVGKNNCLLLLASATPSIESYSLAKSGKYKLCKLNNRYGNAVLPDVEVVDTRFEVSSGNSGAVSRELYQRLENTLSDGNQAIILLNRRGYNTYVSCPSCGYVVTCDNCSISMTYHSANNKLMCHYCGASKEYTSVCPNCGSNHMRYSGMGTQRVEDELKQLFPNAEVLRLDADSTMTRRAFDDGLVKFSKGEYDILLGTQMVAKGLDFPKVTLVGVLGADRSMYSDDFRSFEKTFSLLTQVIGRSGRGDKKGLAVIQTADPDSKIISLAKNQDYDAFYNDEILTRKLMVYPPYCDIVAVVVSSKNKLNAENASKQILELIKTRVKNGGNKIKLIALGPTVPTVPKVNNKYRYRLFIKTKNTKEFRNMLSCVIKEFFDSKHSSDISVYVDVNPEGMG